MRQAYRPPHAWEQRGQWTPATRTRRADVERHLDALAAQQAVHEHSHTGTHSAAEVVPWDDARSAYGPHDDALADLVHMDEAFPAGSDGVDDVGPHEALGGVHDALPLDEADYDPAWVGAPVVSVPELAPTKAADVPDTPQPGPAWTEPLSDEALHLFLADVHGKHRRAPARVAPRVASVAPLRSVHDLYDWRGMASSQQDRSMHGRPSTELLPRFEPAQWVRTRRWPSLSLLLRAAQTAVYAVLGVLRTPSIGAAIAVAGRRYQNHWRTLLALERGHQENALAELRQRPLPELVALGVALSGLQGHWQTERHFGQRVGVFKLPGAQRLPRHRLVPGTMIDLRPVDADGDWYKPRTSSRHVTLRMLDRLVAPPSAKESGQRQHITAELVDCTARQVRLRFSEAHEHIDLAAIDTWRFDRGENNVVNDRMESALDALMYDPNDTARASTPERRYALVGTPLRDLLLPLPPALRETPAEGVFSRDARIRSWYTRYAQPTPVVVEGDPALGLNPSQTRAVAMMLKEPLSLVQGPPGTGKTRTLVQAVSLLKQHFHVTPPILLAAHTNVAVDNLAAGCLRQGLRVVRAGSAAAARPSLAEHTLEAHTARHPKHTLWEQVQSQLKALQTQRTAVQGELRAAAKNASATAKSASPHDPASPLRDRLRALQRKIRGCIAHAHTLRSEIRASVLHGADVVCATAISAGSQQMAMIDFPVVFVDEGSMATEPVALIPLMKGCAQLALIGDHKQLPPVLLSNEARRGGLSTSLFERLIRQGTPQATSAEAQQRPCVPSVMLDEQFRMHPQLAAFPNAAFYQGALRDAPSTAARTPLASAYAATDAAGRPSPVTFVAHAPMPTSTSSTGSVLSSVSPFNVPQADLALALLCDLLARNPTLRGEDIGIVTPYEAQVRLLQRMLAAGTPAMAVLPGDEALPYLSEHAVQTLAHAHPDRAAQLASIEVHTVDGFEGREKPVMLFSTVKTGGGAWRGTAALQNALAYPSAATAARLADLPTLHGGYVGFLADTRRLNVALTRAQCQLFVLGNLDTMLSARLGHAGEKSVECSDVYAIRAYARWLLAQGCVVEMDSVRDRLLEEAQGGRSTL